MSGGLGLSEQGMVMAFLEYIDWAGAQDQYFTSFIHPNKRVSLICGFNGSKKYKQFFCYILNIFVITLYNYAYKYK